MTALELAVKTCKCCGETKPVTEFYVKPANRDGRHSCCRTCETARVLEWQAKRRAEIGDEAFLAGRREIVNRSRRARGYDTERRSQRIRWRALQRLVGAHRREYERYLAEEERSEEAREQS